MENETICVMGLGYVGLPLSLILADKFVVYGYDVDAARVKLLRDKRTNIKEIDVLRRLQESENFYPTSDPSIIGQSDFIIVCVPTPISEDKTPDLSDLIDAVKTIKQYLKRGQTIIIESTTYPGTTDEVITPILQETGLITGEDFYVAFSPERMKPGESIKSIITRPKVVGGINEKSAEAAIRLYSQVIHRVVKVKDVKTAEAVKMLENIFRCVNIALVNEMAIALQQMGIDTWQVIEAASTKPAGFLPHYPGPGVGGHCIPVDPYYFVHQAHNLGIKPKLIETALEINQSMPHHVVSLVTEGLRTEGKKVGNSQIAIIGLAYKADIDDVRESPARKIIEEIINLGGKVKVYDPYARMIETNCGKFTSEKTIDNVLQGADCAIFITDHTELRNMESDKLMQRDLVIVDCRNILKHKNLDTAHYFGIGISRKGIP